ncbi:MAG: hypothetical protein V4642_07005 [Bacteroidota bacterium]
MNRFHLSKWYMDAISADGDVLICYAAHLKWGLLSIPFSQIIFHAGSFIAKTGLFKNAVFPKSQDGFLKLKIGEDELTWNQLAEAKKFTLYDSPRGKIEWNVMMPSAAFTTNSGEFFKNGLGYIEKLEMTIPPWKLPISQLRWGRFVSEKTYCTWIEWKGDHPKILVICDGEVFENAEISEEEIYIPQKDLRLKLSKQKILREGNIGGTAFKKIPFFHVIFPSKVLKMYEWKARSFGEIFKNGEKISHGWAIHEIVRFT